MPQARHVVLVSGWILALSACESSRPSAPGGRPAALNDPAALSAAAAALDTLMRAPAARSLGALASLMTFTTAYQFPVLPVRAADCAAAARPAARAAGFPLAVMPDSFLGRTMAYDTSRFAFVIVADSGGPPNGVLVLMPAVDSQGALVRPPGTAGTFTLADSSGDSTTVRFGEVLADDVATVTARAALAGTQRRWSVGLSGRMAAAGRAFTFADSMILAPGSIALFAASTDSAAHWQLTQSRLRFDAFDYRDTFDLTAALARDTVRLAGVRTVFCLRGSTTATFFAGGTALAVLQYGDSAPVVMPADSTRPLAAGVVDAIIRVATLRPHFYPWIGGLVTPGAQFLSH